MPKARAIISTIVIIFIFISSPNLMGQNTTNTTIKGKVIDSSLNKGLEASTVTIYKTKDSTLVNYTLSDIYGNFTLDNIPHNQELYIIINAIGYHPLYRQLKFTDSNKINKVTLYKFKMQPSTKALNDVIVKSVPPITMNNDTIEFHADAFKMDPNAVVEDLLRRLPGVIVWGDGAITVNGRPVPSVLVNGKPFFGGNAKISTQNISKEAVDKIQVYSKNNQNHHSDSTLEANIQLKKGHEKGYFGKMIIGEGTTHRHNLLGNINIYNNKIQLGVIGTNNNVNNFTNDINTLIANSTYKGIGASLDLQPDFESEGNNKTLSTGFTLRNEIKKNSTLNLDYLFQNRKNNLYKSANSIRNIAQDSTQNTLLSSNDDNKESLRTLKAKYMWKNNKSHLSVSTQLNFTDGDSNIQDSTEVFIKSNPTLQSKSYSKEISASKSNSKHIKINYGLKKRNGLDDVIGLTYEFNQNWNRFNNKSETSFQSEQDPTQNLYFNRQYKNLNEKTNHNLLFEANNMLESYSNRYFGGIIINTKNEFNTSIILQDNNIYDHLDNELLQNKYLTVVNHTRIINERPTISLIKDLNRDWPGRYNKKLSFQVDFAAQLYEFQNKSTHDFQVIKKFHIKSIPSFAFSYDYRNSNLYNKFSFNFKRSYRYPILNELAPTTDSSNIYFLNIGNKTLVPSTTNSFIFGITHFGLKKYPWSYFFNFRLDKTNKYFADSSSTDSLGRTISSFTNFGAQNRIAESFRLEKSFVLNKNQFSLSLNENNSYSIQPVFINSRQYQSKYFVSSSFLSMNYELIDLFQTMLITEFRFSKSRQEANNVEGIFKYNNNEFIQTLSGSFNITKRFNISSNVKYHRYSTAGLKPINYVIWNASATFRCLKLNNLEFKFSALDLLHQNSSVINIASNNTFRQIQTNVLQQYFMLSVAFYPRNFGKNPD